jgi:hypothetical protein
MGQSSKRHPLDGYDYTATVMPGTPLVVRSLDGRTWRLARKGIRYHSDCATRIYGARQIRAPKEVAASDRIRTLLESLLGAGELPEGIGQPVTRWDDAPDCPGSMAAMPSLTLYADRWVRALVPVYDDAPRTGARQLSQREARDLAKDMAIAPHGVRLQSVSVRERTVRVEGSHPLAARCAHIPAARPHASHRVYQGEPGYTGTDGLPIVVPEPGTGWDVPVTAWRALTGEAA